MGKEKLEWYVSARKDPWERIDFNVVDINSEYRCDQALIVRALEKSGLSFKSNDLSGPAYASDTLPNTYVRISVRHKRKGIIPLIIREDPVADSEVEPAKDRLRALEAQIVSNINYYQGSN